MQPRNTPRGRHGITQIGAGHPRGGRSSSHIARVLPPPPAFSDPRARAAGGTVQRGVLPDVEFADLSFCCCCCPHLRQALHLVTTFKGCIGQPTVTWYSGHPGARGMPKHVI